MKPLPTDEDILASAIAAWRTAKVLHHSGSWKGQPPAAHFVEILSGRPELEKSLLQLLKDDEQLVAAYALITLERMNSPALRNLSADLLNRKEKVTSRLGSFSDKLELGALARHIQKKCQTRQK